MIVINDSLDAKLGSVSSVLNSLLCLFQWEPAGHDLLDIDLAAADETDCSWPSVSVPEEELQGNLVGMNRGSLPTKSSLNKIAREPTAVELLSCASREALDMPIFGWQLVRDLNGGATEIASIAISWTFSFRVSA